LKVSIPIIKLSNLAVIKSRTVIARGPERIPIQIVPLKSDSLVPVSTHPETTCLIRVRHSASAGRLMVGVKICPGG
jgi:hypothetical protein